MPDIIINSGVWGYIIVFMAINALILLITQLLVKKKVLFYISTIFAFVPIVSGFIGTVIGKMQVEQAMALTDNVEILNEAMMIANTPMTFGFYVSIPLFVLLVINMVYSRR